MRVVATAGHVDHGKSSLVEALTGTHPDRLEEERRRGLTIDLGFAHLTLPTGDELGFVDVPGHVRFLRNMLAGVGGVDACLFVVAATEGWKPQSEEHLRILQLVGVRHGVIAMTKADLVDEEWRELQAMDIRERVAGSFLANEPLVAVSSTTGHGLDELRSELGALSARTPAAVDRDRPRLWIDRVFAAKGSGTIVTGTLTGGWLRVDQHLDAVPAGRAGRVRGLQTHGRSLNEVGPGNRVAVNLGGIDHTAVRRGDALVEAARWRPTNRFDASLEVLASLRHDVSRRGAYVAYIGSGEFPVKLRVLGATDVAPGATAYARIHLPTRLALLPGDRFVLRESGRNETVGGGEVLDVAPLRRAAHAQPSRSIERLVAEHRAIDIEELEALTGEQHEPTVGRWKIDATYLGELSADLQRRVALAGSLGFDIASLDDVQRAVLATLDGVRIDAGRAFEASVADPFAEHPMLSELRRGWFAPPEPNGLDRTELRELVRRKLLVELEGLYFHPDAIDAAAVEAARLLVDAPQGFTMSQLRERLGVSRKYALPLANALDARGVTRRRGDLRIGGPRLPQA
jgi:selenocysteine-specific elongation factor